MKKTRFETPCIQCGKIREVIPAIFKMGRGRFCSRSCAQNYKWSIPEYRKQMSESHNGQMPTNITDLVAMSRSKTTKGYRTVKMSNGKKQQAHRVIIQERMERELKQTEHVHHWNEKKDDNRIENLAVMRHLAAHRRLHAFADRHDMRVELLKFAQPWLFKRTE